jgi:hypothetical protein
VHPPVLSDRGLDAALSGLAALSPVPVTVHVDLPVRPRGKTLYRVNATASSGDLVVGVLHSSVSRHVITVTDGSGNVSVTY